jgi:hypothetical protein
MRFCYIARGSLEETISHVVFARRVGYIPENLYQAIATDGENLNRLINGYIGFLKKSKQGVNEPGVHYAVGESSIDHPFEESSPPSNSNIE